MGWDKGSFLVYVVIRDLEKHVFHVQNDFFPVTFLGSTVCSFKLRTVSLCLSKYVKRQYYQAFRSI